MHHPRERHAAGSRCRLRAVAVLVPLLLGAIAAAGAGPAVGAGPAGPLIDRGGVLPPGASPSARAAFKLGGRRWPGRRITYYNGAGQHAWAIDQATKAWNAAGQKMKLVRTTSKKKAQLVISYFPGQGPQDQLVGQVGEATLGYVPKGGKTIVLGPNGPKVVTSRAYMHLTKLKKPEDWQEAPVGLTAAYDGAQQSIDLRWTNASSAHLAGVEVGMAADACPAAPDGSASEAAQKGAQQSLSLPTGGVSGHVCVAVWSRDVWGRLSPTAATQFVDVPDTRGGAGGDPCEGPRPPPECI